MTDAQATAVGRDVDGDVRERVFAELVAGHRDRAVSIAWRLIGGDRGAAEDIAQEAFIKAYRSLDQFRGEGDMAAWFYRIVVRLAHNERRWRAVRERFARVAGRSAEPTFDGSRDHGLVRRIADAMERLSRGQREAFVLVYLEEMTITEAAETLERAPGTIKSHLHRALATMRAELGDLREGEEPK